MRPGRRPATRPPGRALHGVRQSIGELPLEPRDVDGDRPRPVLEIGGVRRRGADLLGDGERAGYRYAQGIDENPDDRDPQHRSGGQSPGGSLATLLDACD